MVNLLSYFDIFNRAELPIITLCNPNRVQLGQLADPLNLSVTLKFNALSEIKFQYPYQLDYQIKSPFYDELVAKRVLFFPEFGYFTIQTNNEVDDGVQRYREITALSSEVELSYRKLNLFDGLFQFYDLVSPSKTLLGQIVAMLPNWSIGHVDAHLMGQYRDFEIPDTTIYNFLMTTVEESFSCIFLFDTVNRVINAYTVDNLIKYTDIYLDYINLLKQTNVEEITDELVTVMNVYGGDNLDISGVNPLGSAQIFKYKYFEPMMTPELVAALHNWEAKIAVETTPYKTNLLQLQTLQRQLLMEQATLIDLQAKAVATEGVVSAQIEQGIDKSNPPIYQETYNKWQAELQAVKNQEEVIAKLKTQEQSLKDTLTAISTSLRIENNLSLPLRKELDNYRYESTYQDDTFITTDVMSLEETQKMQQALYDQAVELLNRVSQPRYTFSVDCTNFLFLKEFQPYINQLELGSMLHVAVHDDEYTEPILLEISFEYGNQDSFSMTFANRYRLDNASWQFSDLYQSATSAGSTVNFNSNSWNDWTAQRSEVNEFINSALDLTKNELINNATSQTMVMNENGLRGRKLLSDGSYDGKQIWLTNNILAFSDDGFRTVKTAIGNIQLPNGNNGYGVAGDILLGNIVFGQNLVISNDSGTIRMDNNGFTYAGKGGSIYMHPDNGLSISFTGNGQSFTTNPSNGVAMNTQGNNSSFATGSGGTSMAVNGNGSSFSISPANGLTLSLTGPTGTISMSPSTGLAITFRANNQTFNANGAGVNIATSGNGTSFNTSSNGTAISTTGNNSSFSTSNGGTSMAVSGNNSTFSISPRDGVTLALSGPGGSISMSPNTGISIGFNSNGTSFNSDPQSGTSISTNGYNSSFATGPNGTSVAVNGNNSSFSTNPTNGLTINSNRVNGYSSFSLTPENGITLMMTSNNGYSRVVMNPIDGFRLQTKSGNSWYNKVYLNANGDAFFDGTIEARAGHIGGFIIANNRLKSTITDSSAWGGFPSVVDIGGNGYGRISLLEYGPSYARFHGTVYGDKITDGSISWDKTDNNFIYDITDDYEFERAVKRYAPSPNLSNYVTKTYLERYYYDKDYLDPRFSSWNNTLKNEIAAVEKEITALEKRVSRLER